MSDIAQFAAMARGEEKHDQLTVESRVLRAGSRTIAIANISHVQLEQPGSVAGKRGLLFIVGAVLGIVGIAQIADRSIGPGVLLVALAAGAIYWALSLKDLFALAVTSNDGSRTLFTGTNLARLREAMEFVTAKIDLADQTSRTTFNFNNSTIVGSQMGDVIRN